MIKTIPSIVKFGSHDIKDSNIFYYRKYVFAFVNIRPVVPGHVLLCPVRKEKKFRDLTETEAMELWISAKKIADSLKKFYNTDSVQISIQDGDDAGQTVDHCHIHIIPFTKKLNFNNQDGIDNRERADRTPEEMDKEAEIYRESFVLN